jgi:hypothetical protein
LSRYVLADELTQKNFDSEELLEKLKTESFYTLEPDEKLHVLWYVD